MIDDFILRQKRNICTALTHENNYFIVEFVEMNDSANN
jgi:hypothetical protein